MQLKNSRIVVVNDDGISAHGISLLERAARMHSDDVWVVAPASDQSGRARAMSYRREVTVQRRGERHYSVDGTPADCIIVALNGVLKNRPVDLILSGINDGENVADDVASSGTVGACLEGADQDVPGIAFSQGWGERGDKTDWTCAQTLTGEMLPALADAITDSRTVLNVNFPALADARAVAGCRVVHAGWRLGPTTLEERAEKDGDRVFYIESLREDKPNEPDCDLDQLARGFVTVTPLTLDQTNYGILRSVSDRLNETTSSGGV